MGLSTRYMGLALRNPLVASPSPLSNTLDGIRRLADADGWTRTPLRRHHPISPV